MKKLLPALAIIATLSAGCASYNISTVGDCNTIEIQNTGWFLFNFIPIASGDPRYPNENRCMFFRDSVSINNNMSILRRAMAKTSATRADNVVSHSFNEKVLWILLKRYAIHTSAELSK